MKVLAINLSPRIHGNSDILCDQFLKGAAEAGHVTEKIRLADTISGLRGLLRCLPDAQEKEIIYGTGTWNKGDVLQHPELERDYEAGKTL